MKRKIVIVIAAIVAMTGLAASGLLSETASAAKYCSFSMQEDTGDRGLAKKRRCANIMMVDHNSDMMYACGASGSQGNSTNCLIKIGESMNFSATTSYAYAADQEFSEVKKAIGAIIAGGESTWNPCKTVIQMVEENPSNSNYINGKNTCFDNNKQWMYYVDYDTWMTDHPNGTSSGYVPGPSGSTSPSDGSGDDGGSSSTGEESPADTGECTSILPGLFCDKDNPDSNGEGIKQLIRFIIGVMTGAVVVAGTVGIVICGVMMMTARDNEAQVTTAKRRLFEIVIGIVAWGLIAVLINFFIPQNEDTTEGMLGAETSINGKKDA